MEPSKKMKRSVEQLLHDLRVADERLKSIKTEIGYLDYGHHGEARVLRLKELTADLHARLEGMREFVIACREAAVKEVTEDQEDIDIWM